jgi:secreted PhoX family phosphatase
VDGRGQNGEITVDADGNPDRGNTAPGVRQQRYPTDVDAANPRWLGNKGVSSQNAIAIAAQRGNVNGHIVRIKETGDNAGAETFVWDIFLFGTGRPTAAWTTPTTSRT